MIERPRDHSDRLRRGELADEEEADALAAEHPDEALRRREFLARTAALAGAAGLAATLPLDELVSAAGRSQARRAALPNPRGMPIDTFVVFMMENRSFDHYFGWHPQADARNEGLRYPDATGKKIPTHHLTPDYQGCGHPDPNHGWSGGRWQYNGGRNNRFVTGNENLNGSDEFAIGYYLKEDLDFLPHLADAYTLYDRWFCSIMASTYPNRHYQMSAQGGGFKGNTFPPQPGHEDGFSWETIFDRALARGVGVGYYVSDLPPSGLYGARGLSWVRPVSQFYADATAGTLPPVTFVDPPFGDSGVLGGGANLTVAGSGASDHPHSDIRLGQAFMSDIAHAFIESPQYERGAMFINYDEWGGFFDHVPPPFVPDERRNRKDLEEDWGFTGFRVPGVAISPYARGGRVAHMTVTHESILKLISYRYGLGHLTERHRYASNIGHSFDFRQPDFTRPELPSAVALAATPCATSEQGEQKAKPHGMVELQTSGWLERIGYEVQPATLERIFREPDAIRRALAEGSRK